MPAKNVYHDAVVDALKADGWTITDDPLTLKVGDRVLRIDLGAEKLPIGAERNGERIAVEVQSFTGPRPSRTCNRRWDSFSCTAWFSRSSNRIARSFVPFPNKCMMGSWRKNLGNW